MAGRSIEIIRERNEEAHRYWSKLGSDVAMLESRGYTVHELDDYCFESLRKLERKSVNEQVAGLDLFRGVKKIAADKLADYFGLQPGFLRDIITNFVAGLGIADLRAMFSPGACKTVVTKLAAAVQGALIDKVITMIGLQPDNFITIAITEAIKSGFVQEGPFVRLASQTVCKIKFSDLLPGAGKGGLSALFKGGDKGAQVAANITQAATGAAPPTTPATTPGT
jgi:hypothetical protein